MSTINGKPFSTPRNINLRGGLLRFDVTNASNPFGDTSYGLYVDASGNLIYRNLTTSVTLGAAGSGGGAAPSWDAIIAGDQTLQMGALPTLTIDRNSGNADVLTITNTGAGSGDLIQITNAGTGNDIEGTSDTWHFTKAGDMTANTVVFAGDAGSNSLTLTAGDVVFSDGSVAITDADNAASLTVTNDTATTASVVVLTGSGTFTGSTTTSWMTITPSGLTTGTAVYLPVAALTTGKAIHLVGDAVTTGQLLHISSSAAGTQLTGAGRLVLIEHSGTATSTGTLVEISSAAADETVIAKITASGALAGGVALSLATSSVTTGTLISALGAAITTGAVFACTDLAALTTGHGIVLTHATSAITTGSLLEISSSGVNTGAGGDGTLVNLTATGQLAGSLVTLDTIQTTGTAMSIISTGVMTTTGNLLTLTANSATTAAGLVRINANGLTSGIGLVVTSSSTGLTGAGRLVYVNHTGNAGNASGVVAEIASAAADETVVFRVTGSAALASGVLVDLSASALTTGTVLDLGGLAAITSGNGIVVAASGTTRTSGMLVSITCASTAADATGRMLLVNHTGITGANTVLSEVRSAATDETVLFKVTASAANALGKGIFVSTATTTGNGIQVTANALTDGFGITVDSTATTLTSTGRLFLVNSAGATGTSAVVSEIKSAATDETVVFQVLASAALALGKAVNVSVAAMTTGLGLSIDDADALTTGGIASFTSNSADATARSLVHIHNDNAAAVGAIPLEIVNDAVTGTGSKFTAMIKVGGTTIWRSIDQTTPNGALTATAGDICVNGPSSVPMYCTGTNVWVALA